VVLGGARQEDTKRSRGKRADHFGCPGPNDVQTGNDVQQVPVELGYRQEEDSGDQSPKQAVIPTIFLGGLHLADGQLCNLSARVALWPSNLGQRSEARIAGMV
jgi:hypothetical protein